MLRVINEANYRNTTITAKTQSLDLNNFDYVTKITEFGKPWSVCRKQQGTIELSIIPTKMTQQIIIPAILNRYCGCGLDSFNNVEIFTLCR